MPCLVNSGIKMSIRVLYDSYSFDREKVGGITRYFSEIIKNVPPSICPIVSTVVTDNEYMKAPPFNINAPKFSYGDFLTGVDFPGKYRLYRFLSRNLPSLFPGKEELNELSFKQKLKCGEYDLIHLTGQGTAWHRYVGKVPIVVTMHDLIPELVNHDQHRRIWRQKMLSIASHVIAVSENTRKDLLREYDVDEDKITTIYHGFSASITSEDVSFLSGVRFVLYVGKRAGYKNFEFMVQALSPIFMKDTSLKLVCTGAPFSPSELEFLEKFGMAKKVICQCFRESELRWLFEHAQVFVYPSRYEGFGIPILEAFSAGCPTLLSRASCFPEVADNGALYFELDAIEDFQVKFCDIIYNQNLREKMVGLGYERVKCFSWQRAAEKTASVYEKVVRDWKCSGE